jgi:hypothetical protein
LQAKKHFRQAFCANCEPASPEKPLGSEFQNTLSGGADVATSRKGSESRRTFSTNSGMLSLLACVTK